MADTSDLSDPPPPTQEEGEGVEVEGGRGGAGPIEVADFFPEVNDDLSEVTWGHGVNSVAELEAALADPKIMMVEADIILGHVEEVKEGGAVTSDPDPDAPPTPIMAHPPQTTSDLTFKMWLDKVIAANEEGKKKGIKLDFKKISVVKECLDQLNANKDKITFPVWLNADILPGPIASLNTPVPANEFLELCGNLCPQATLSLGWTTTLPPTSTGVVGGGYTQGMAGAMVEVLEKNSITQPVTFPVRAAFLPHSIDALEWLIDTVPDSTITIWSSETDPFDPMTLVTLRDLLGAEAVYIDLPQSLMTQYKEAMAASMTRKGGEGAESYLPNTASVLATVGMALASALAALYLYE